METPIIDLLEKYAGAGTLRCHMPGHKGCRRRAVGEVFPLDITEIKGADSLFEASGIPYSELLDQLVDLAVHSR